MHTIKTFASFVLVALLCIACSTTLTNMVKTGTLTYAGETYDIYRGNAEARDISTAVALFPRGAEPLYKNAIHICTINGIVEIDCEEEFRRALDKLNRKEDEERDRTVEGEKKEEQEDKYSLTYPSKYPY